MLAFYRLSSILGLKSIPGDSNDKDTAAMFVELSTEANEESFMSSMTNHREISHFIYGYSQLPCNGHLLKQTPL